MITNNYLHAFIAGVIAVFPSIMPTLISLKKKNNIEAYKLASLETKLIWMPILYGILNIIVFKFVNMLPVNFRNYWVVGAIMGLIYPTLGTIKDYAKKMYDIKSYKTLYINAQLLYLPFYGIIIKLIMDNLC